MSKNKVTLLTIVVWLVGTSVYAYQWVTSALADPGIAPYERNLVFPLAAFIFARGIYPFFGIIILIWIELMFFETLLENHRGLHATHV
jgi:hypothetical protein